MALVVRRIKSLLPGLFLFHGEKPINRMGEIPKWLH
jgi:hypothetical protein